MNKILVAIFSFSIMLISCERDKHIKIYKLPKNDLRPAQIETQLSKEFSIIWGKPRNWKQVEGHTIRLASFIAPYSEGTGDVSVITLNGFGGGITLNVNRWLVQIGLEAVSDSGIDLISEKKTGLLGEFSYFKLVNNRDKSVAILASIFQLKDRMVFVKLSSSLIGVNEIEADFLKFCNSLDQTR